MLFVTANNLQRWRDDEATGPHFVVVFLLLVAIMCSFVHVLYHVIVILHLLEC